MARMIAPVLADANEGDFQIADLARGDAQHIGDLFRRQELGDGEGHDLPPLERRS